MQLSFQTSLQKLLNPWQRDFLYCQLLFWLGAAILFRILWLGYVPPPLSWFALYAVSGLSVSYLLGLIYWHFRDRSFGRQCLLALLVAGIFAVVWRVTFNAFDFHLYLREDPDRITPLRYLYRGSYSALQLYGWSAVYLLLSWYEKYHRQRERALTAELELRKSEIRRLHQQASPHLIFNVLHSLDTLLLKGANAEARAMVGKLSLYLRDTLSGASSVAVPLAQEIKQTRHYLDIEATRFQERLQVEWHLEGEWQDVLVPNLLLQPLVENAIRHGVDQWFHGGKVEIVAKVQAQELLLTVRNTPLVESSSSHSALVETVLSQAPLNDKAAQHWGIGLQSTRQKLTLMYKDTAKLTTAWLEKGGFVVNIQVPLATAREADFPL